MLSNFLLFACRLCLLWLTLCSPLAATEARSPPPILVGGSPDALHNTSVTDAEIGFSLIFNEMLAKIDESFIIKIYDSNEHLVEDFRDGKIQAIFTTSLHFIELGELIHRTGRYVVHFDKSLKQRCLLLVRRENAQLKLADLRNHKISLATNYQVGKLFLDVELLQQGLPASEQFFSSIELVHNVNTAVVDLFFGKVDVVLVPEFSYKLAKELNPQINSSLTVLNISEPMIYGAVGMRYDFPQSRMNLIEPYILETGPTGRLRHLLDTFRITKLQRMNDEMLKEVRELKDTYQTLIQRSP